MDLYQYIIILFALALLFFYLTNPYSRKNIVKRPFETYTENSEILYRQKYRIKVKNNLIYRIVALIKCGYYIVSNVYYGGYRTKKGTLKEIISHIHKSRFNPKKPYLISGDHFNMQFSRNLGIFYYPTLDPRISHSQEEWEDRQRIFLQSVAYNLEVYRKTEKLSTTIVPMGRTTVTTLNIYSYPSDTLYSLLFSIKILIDNKLFENILPFNNPNYKNQTKKAGQQLLQEYRKSLIQHLKEYKENLIDKKTGLVTTERHFSAAKDITKRNSSFYDNVIYWRTLTLAHELGLSKEKGLKTLKSRIIKTFYLEEDGYFLEDLSEEGLREKFYTSDWLVVFFTQFLDMNKAGERRIYERCVEYIRKENLAIPFPIKYQQDDRKKRQVLPVRLVIGEYGGSAIWSFWGVEYIKVLLRLYQLTKKGEYLSEAKKHLNAYSERIVKYRGFPEVYDNKGKLLKTKFYKSVMQTGWVVNFEQAKMLYESLCSRLA